MPIIAYAAEPGLGSTMRPPVLPGSSTAMAEAS